MNMFDGLLWPLQYHITNGLNDRTVPLVVNQIPSSDGRKFFLSQMLDNDP